MSRPVVETPVLIVGGGPVGLALALDLSQRGIRNMLVERDPGTGCELLAKAGTLNERTMEYCRRLGVAEAVAAEGFPDDYPRDTVYCTSLNGFLLGRDPLPSTNQRALFPESPELLRKCPQYVFDPLLADAVAKGGHTDLRYSTSFVSLQQDDNGVTADLSTADGEVTQVRAQYLVGCDGAGSRIRQALGIEFEGKQLDYSVSMMLYCNDLARFHPYGKCERWMFVGTEGTWANITTVDGRGLYRFTIIGSPERIAPDRLDIPGLLRRAAGRDDLPWHVVNVMPWRRSQYTAHRFSQGRVFLAGDAVHTTSPTGGHGLNTGLGDASDLAWMLQALVDGWGGPLLSEAYSAERRPVAIRNSTLSTRNYKAWVNNDGYEHILADTPDGAAQRSAAGARMSAMLQQEWRSFGVAMGYRYDDSPIVVPDGTEPTPDEVHEYIQTTRPGHRAPHAWLPDGRSTIDLFGTGFTLLRLGPNPPDAAMIEKSCQRAGLPLTVISIDQPDVVDLYERALVLVRPDGMVAWRSNQPPDDADALVDTVRGAARYQGA